MTGGEIDRKFNMDRGRKWLSKRERKPSSGRGKDSKKEWAT